MNQLTTNQRQEFITCARGILASETVQKMKQYPQHGKTNALCHMVSVAWCAYSTAIKLEEKYGIRFDRRSIIRGSLLHDLFLYDWHDPNNGHKFHGFSHPYTALENAEKHFYLNNRQDTGKVCWYPMPTRSALQEKPYIETSIVLPAMFVRCIGGIKAEVRIDGSLSDHV